jgi:hypothetical protein
MDLEFGDGQAFAISGKDGELIRCKEARWSTWYYRRGGQRRCLLELATIGHWKIKSEFCGRVQAPDGADRAQFWRVTVTGSSDVADSRKKDPSGGLLGAIETDASRILSKKCSTIEELLSTKGPTHLQHWFDTREQALNFHSESLKKIRARQRLERRKPELEQELLAQLALWCSGRFGRQALVATQVETTRQTVSDWLAGRKHMTGEQALRVQALLKKQPRLSK